MHLIAYITLAFSIGFILPRSFRVKIAILFTIFSLSLFGGLIEILQGFTGRSTELLDLLFDAAGATIGVLTYFIFIQFVNYFHKKKEEN